ncbi:MAG: iron-containing alcohol dehydrogenase, partial [Longicatena sp.]
MKRFILNETSYHGYGAIEGIILEIKQRNFKKALIVTDEDLVKFKVINKVTDLMDKEGFPYVVYDGVKANPTVDMVKEGVAIFAQNACDYLIAIGGGSPQDTAKGIGIITNNPEFGDVLSLEGTAETKHKSVPMIAVATTAGTAAETTINYVITDTEKRRKFVCVDPHD